MREKGKVRFIRKGGRIIPIKIYKEDGNKISANTNIHQKKGRTLINAGSIGLLGVGASLIASSVLRKFGLKKATETIGSAISYYKAKAKGIGDLSGYADKTKKLFKHQKFLKETSDIALMASGPLFGASLAAILTGASLSIKGAKLKSLRTRNKTKNFIKKNYGDDSGSVIYKKIPKKYKK